MKLSSSVQNTLNRFNPWWSNAPFPDTGVKRPSYLHQLTTALEQKNITFLIGSRRTGKTTLLFQLIRHLLETLTISPQQIFFTSLDNINLTDFDLYNYITSQNFTYLFLDEIQDYPQWQRTLKSLFDLPGQPYTIFCSGSSWKKIYEHKGLLTGRNRGYEVYPLDFHEYRLFTPDNPTVDAYLQHGGYPEYVLEHNPNYHSELIQDIIHKDIVSTYQLRHADQLLELLSILAKQISTKASYNKLATATSLANDTTKHYLTYLADVQLISPLSAYATSQKERVASQKKYYFLDTGMRNALVGYTDYGALAENAVFTALLRHHGQQNIFYIQDNRGREVDFLVQTSPTTCELIEVKYTQHIETILPKLPPFFTKDTLYDLQVTNRTIITDNLDATIQHKGKTITCQSLESFLGSVSKVSKT